MCFSIIFKQSKPFKSDDKLKCTNANLSEVKIGDKQLNKLVMHIISPVITLFVVWNNFNKTVHILKEEEKINKWQFLCITLSDWCVHEHKNLAIKA